MRANLMPILAPSECLGMYICHQNGQGGNEVIKFIHSLKFKCIKRRCFKGLLLFFNKRINVLTMLVVLAGRLHWGNLKFK